MADESAASSADRPAGDANATHTRAVDDTANITPRRAALAALFLPTVVFLGASNSVIFANLLDIPYSRRAALGFAAAFVLGSAAALPVFVRAGRSRGAAAVVRVMLAAGVAILFFDAAGVASTGRIQRLPAMILLDAGAILLAGAVAWRASLPVLLRTFSVIAPLLLAHGVGFHGWQYQARVVPGRAMLTRYPDRPPAAPAPVGNVYHVILDGFQSEAYPALVRAKPELRLPGFTQYTQFVANYDYTINSVPSLLGGRAYEPGESVVAWRAAALQRGLWWDLQQAGMRLALYPYYSRDAVPFADTLRVGHQVFVEAGTEGRSVGGGVSAAERTTIDLWFLNLLPRTARVVLNVGWEEALRRPILVQGIADQWFSITDLLAPPPRDRPGLVRWFHSPAVSAANFERLLADEAERPPQGQYVFVHLLGPHFPYVLDGACTYRGIDSHRDFKEADVDGYLAQAECALRLMHRLLARLRELDRLDDALILVHGDHGAAATVARRLRVGAADRDERWPGDATNPVIGPRTDNEAVRAWRTGANAAVRSRALLLAKFPGAAGAATSVGPAQMLDLAPTMLHHAGANVERYPGAPLQTLAADAVRERRFFMGRNPRNAAPAYLPWGGTFSAFTLGDERWEYTGEVPVRP